MEVKLNQLFSLGGVQSLYPMHRMFLLGFLRMKNVEKSFTLLGREHPWYFMSAQPSSYRGSQVRLDHNQEGFRGLWDVSSKQTSSA